MMPTFGRSTCLRGIAVAALLSLLGPSLAPAKPLRRPAGGAPAYAAPMGSEDPYNPYAIPGAAIRAQSQINQNAPGLTNELAPGNIATATGGPSGGVPGFSGH